MKALKNGISVEHLENLADKIEIGVRAFGDFLAQSQNERISEDTLNKISAWTFGDENYTWLRFTTDNPSPSITTEKFSNLTPIDRQKIERGIEKAFKKYEQSEKSTSSNIRVIDNQLMKELREIREEIKQKLEELQNSRISLDEFRKVEKLLAEESEAKRKLEKDAEIKERQSDEQIKKLLDQISTILGKQRSIDEDVKKEVNSLLAEGKYDDAELVLHYLQLTDQTNADFNFLFATVKKLKLKYQEALIYYLKALESQPSDITFLNSIAFHYCDLGDYQSGLRYFRKAFKINLKTESINQYEIAYSHINIANTLCSLGQYQRGIDTFHFAYKIYEDLKLFNHPYVAYLDLSFGDVWLKLGDFENAIKYFTKAKNTFIKVFGRNHFDTAKAYMMLGAVYSIKPARWKSIINSLRALLIFRQILPKMHPHFASIYNNLGIAFERYGTCGLSILCLNKAIKINSSIYGVKNEKVTQVHINMGITLMKIRRYKLAIDCFEWVLDIYSDSSYPEDHPSYAILHNNLAVAYEKSGNLEKAVENYELARPIYVKKFGADNPFTAGLYNNLSVGLRKLKRYDEAHSYSSQAIAIALKKYGTWNRNTLLFQRNYRRIQDECSRVRF